MEASSEGERRQGGLVGPGAVDPPDEDGVVTAVVARQTRTRGGSIDTEQNDVAVNPHHRPSASVVVTTVTPLGKDAMASRKRLVFWADSHAPHLLHPCRSMTTSTALQYATTGHFKITILPANAVPGRPPCGAARCCPCVVRQDRCPGTAKVGAACGADGRIVLTAS